MTDFPAVDAATLAWIDTEQMREIDRIMIEDLHIELLQMMENAGRALASVVLGTSASATVAPAPLFRLGPVLQLRAG